MYEQLRRDFLTEASKSEILTPLEATAVLDQVAPQYEILEKNDMCANGTIPKEVTDYLACKKMEGLAHTTLNNYELILTIFFDTIHKSIQNITTNDIRTFLYNYQEERNIARSTLDKYRQYIAHFFTWLHKEGMLPLNPTTTLAPIKHEQKARQSLTQIELEYLRLACRTPRDTAILEFLYSTGARVSELTTVKKSDIDWYEKTVLLVGKGNKQRISFLNAKAEVALRRYLESREDNSEYLFVSLKKPHGQLTKCAIEKAVRTLASRTEEVHKKVTPHVFRHTTATVALQNGMPIADISKLLGHESIETTMIYAKSSLEDVRVGHRKYVV